MESSPVFSNPKVRRVAAGSLTALGIGSMFLGPWSAMAGAGGYHEQVAVEASDTDGAATQARLLAGVEYRLRVTGTYRYGAEGFVADAECSTQPGDPTWTRDRYGDAPLDLLVGGAPVEWTPVGSNVLGCDPFSHTYEAFFTPTATGTLTLRINGDAAQTSYVGGLMVEVFGPEVATDEVLSQPPVEQPAPAPEPAPEPSPAPAPAPTAPAPAPAAPEAPAQSSARQESPPATPAPASEQPPSQSGSAGSLTSAEARERLLQISVPASIRVDSGSVDVPTDDRVEARYTTGSEDGGPGSFSFILASGAVALVGVGAVKAMRMRDAALVSTLSARAHRTTPTDRGTRRPRVGLRTKRPSADAPWRSAQSAAAEARLDARSFFENLTA